MRSAPDSSVVEELRSSRADYPLLSTRFLQKGWGFEELDDSMRAEFLEKWHKRSVLSWKELAQHPKHGLGSEFIPATAIIPRIPRQFKDVEKFRVYRHKGNLPFAGWKDGEVFYVLWIEKAYNELYVH